MLKREHMMKYEIYLKDYSACRLVSDRFFFCYFYYGSHLFQQVQASLDTIRSVEEVHEVGHFVCFVVAN